ncbi:TlpA family protein disulfide reductase [Aeromicrobium chenweiae]|nr:thioredoxin family protein [Aeromicrobium chenweiae]
MTGVVVLLVAVVVSALGALAMRWKNGRFSAVPDDREVLSPAQLGSPLGERATMVQFSSAFCSPCRATRVLLNDIAAKVEGVTTVEIDAEQRLELVRELGIMRTPTVLVLDARGVVTTRASGLPRREQVLAALGRAVDVP